MKIALVQTTIIWEDKKSNILHFDKILATVDKNVDIIVFPEMFTTLTSILLTYLRLRKNL